jgi:hypothetical protein
MPGESAIPHFDLTRNYCRSCLILNRLFTAWPVHLPTMEQLAQWHFEVNNPLKSTEWRSLWDVAEDQLVASRELRDELNRINAPVQLRIVRNTH